MTDPNNDPTDASPAPDYSLNRRDVLKTTGGGVLGLAAVSGSGIATTRTGSESNGSMDVTLVSADSEYGFNYPYYFYVPSANRPDERPILVEPNNTGTASDDFEEHRKSAQGLIQHGFCRRISDELRLPLLVPVFPRPSSAPVDYRHYVHALDAETMGISSGKLARVDQQLRKMVKHAEEQLADISFPSNGNIIMNGFSASGNFVNRFTALHPDLVDSASAGGINGTAILPRSNAEGRTLEYPVGIANLESLIGSQFDAARWRDVDQFVYMGAEDDNDTIPYDDAWSEKHRNIALDVYGQNMQEDRMPYCRSVYQNADASARFEVYPGVGHRPAPGIQEDVLKFHKRNAGLFFAAFGERPEAGAESVAVVAGTGTRVDAESFDVRVFDEDGTELTSSPVTMEADDSVKERLELTTALEMDSSVSVAVLEDGASTPDQAIVSKSIDPVGTVRFVDPPVAGDTEVTVEYSLSAAYDVSKYATVTFETEQGGAEVIEEISPGDEDTVAVEVDSDTLGAPLEQNRDVSARLLDGNSVSGTELAVDSTEVEEPDGVAVEVDVDAARVIERGDSLSVEVPVRGLGGSTDDLPITIEANGETVSTETVSLQSPETVTARGSIETGEFGEEELVVTARAQDTSGVTTTILADEPAAGSGTETEPYEITSGSELAYVDLDRDASFVLTRDIDLSTFDRFIRIGDLDEKFSGTFDGQFHEIRNLRIEESLDQFEGVGLFGNLVGGTIRNLHLVDVDVTGQDFVGGVVGMAAGHGEISRVTVSGSVDGDSNVGGIIGGTSTGPTRDRDVVISEAVCHAYVRGDGKVGGIIGQSSGDPVETSYAAGVVSGEHSVAGILGRGDFGAVVSESYASARIEGNGGGVVATNADGTVTNSYWDVEATGLSTSDGGDGLTSAEMTGADAAENLSGFDFDETWRTASDEYPTLRQVPVPDAGSLIVAIVEPRDGIEVSPNEPLQVAVEVTRVSDGEATSTVSLTGVETQFETAVELSAGETERVEFTIPAEDVQDRVTVQAATDSVTDEITVLADESTDATSTTTAVTTTRNTTSGTEAGSDETTSGTTARTATENGEDDTEESATDGSVPGFGIIETLASLGGVSYLVKRRFGDDEE